LAFGDAMKSTLGLVFSTFAFLPLIASAHHSTAEYDGAVIVEVSGTLTSVQWRNPHVQFSVRVEKSGGESEDWVLESSAVYIVERFGLTREMFAPGMEIRVAGHPSRKRNAMEPTNILLPSGTEVAFSTAPKRWAENVIGGAMRNDIVDRAELGLFRVWSLDSDFRLYGRAARAIANARFLDPDNQDPLDSNYAHDPCEPQGMPGIMLNPLPILFVDRGLRVELRLTPFAIVRTISMEGSAPGDTVEPSMFGVSTGKWTNGALEVRTTEIDWPYFDDAGRPLSKTAEVWERFEISEDGNRLAYTQTINDAAMLAEPVTVSWNYIDIGEEAIQPLFCE
jgi:hypothetical protein